jgi:lon-related putative ATP-dependent protease
LEKETAREITAHYFTPLFDKYRESERIIKYLEAMQQDILSHTDIFSENEEPSVMTIFRSRDKKAFLRRYQVNLVVDNSGLKHAPVIIETNPNFANLFGQIEYEGEFGVLATDFSKIKAGSIQRASGGYLILHIYDVVKNYYIWDTLKKVLKNKKIVIESISKNLGFSNTETMEPEPMPLAVKVILIGDPYYYHVLYNYDEEFQKLFKIKADFDTEMERTPGHIKDYARFIASVCVKNNLRHFSREAVARIIEYSSRMAEDQRKLTTLFNKLVEIIYEADCQAEFEQADLVGLQHVNQAIADKRRRSALLEEKIQEHIDRNTLIINVDDEKIGELNGLAVYQTGELAFGKPVRITAKTFMGEKGLVNIEREIRMSGSIHSKGVLTLSGYMGAQYARNKPLGLSASLTFEQSYQGIEGDSASSAELYALLSSLCEVPIKQGIAVTGSVNQNGEIQPVGGVNYKVEGFFEVCQRRGLTGRQGVIIPRQNVADLMLDDEVIEAVKARKFTIWAVSHIDEGIEILTGLQAGTRDKRGHFPPDTLHYLVDQKLTEWHERRKSFASDYRRTMPQGRKRRGRF